MTTSSKTVPEGALWTIDEAAAFLRVSPRLLRRYIALGTIDVVRIGRKTRVREAAVHELVAKLEGRAHG